MVSGTINVIVADVLWFLVIAGWILLIVLGLEADKPLSGGIPGHVEVTEHGAAPRWTLRDRIGSVGSWVLFSLAAASLPFVLWWILQVH
jgi:hypothetical protein